MRAHWITVRRAARTLAGTFGQNMDTDDIVDEIMEMAVGGRVQLGVTSPDSEPLYMLNLRSRPKRDDTAPEWYSPPYDFSEPRPPVVAIETLCVPASELPYIKAIAKGERVPPRDLNEVVIANKRPGLQFVTPTEVADLKQQRSKLAAPEARYDPVNGLCEQAMDQTDVLKSALFAAGVAFGRRVSMQRGKEGSNQSDKHPTPAQADPTRWPSHTPPAPLVDEKRLDDGEPFLMSGINKRADVEKWVEWAAQRVLKTGDTTSDLATKIVELAAKRLIKSERGPLTVGNVTKMLPRGITGKRGRRSGSQSKK